MPPRLIAAGNGGNGIFQGTAINQVDVTFAPFNLSEVNFHSSAAAIQTNAVVGDQSSAQIAAVGGDGGNGNVALAPFPRGQEHGGAEAEVYGAGKGGDGLFAGALFHTAISVYDPVNIAVAGADSHAVADQTNVVGLNQGSVQIAGVGGHGGSGNAALSAFDQPWPSLSYGGAPIGAEAHQAGNGGDGVFGGVLIHASFAIYNPVNIAVAGYGSTAHAEQTNQLFLDQSSFQMAGIGGDGGNDNGVVGNHLKGAPLMYLMGSDAIGFGTSSSGAGGNGFFMGTLADIDLAVYAPINIAVAGYNSTAEAYQSNAVTIDQSTTQLAGIGGDGGNHNLFAGDDWLVDFLGAAHLVA